MKYLHYFIIIVVSLCVQVQRDCNLMAMSSEPPRHHSAGYHQCFGCRTVLENKNTYLFNHRTYCNACYQNARIQSRIARQVVGMALHEEQIKECEACGQRFVPAASDVTYCDDCTGDVFFSDSDDQEFDEATRISVAPELIIVCDSCHEPLPQDCSDGLCDHCKSAFDDNPGLWFGGSKRMPVPCASCNADVELNEGNLVDLNNAGFVFCFNCWQDATDILGGEQRITVECAGCGEFIDIEEKDLHVDAVYCQNCSAGEEKQKEMEVQQQ